MQMHMSKPLHSQSIPKGDQNILAQKLFKRINPDRWPVPLKDLPNETVLVGGTVRDGLLGKLNIKPDLDLIIPKQATELAKELAKKQEGNFIILDSTRDIARVIIKGWSIDLASQIGNNLEDDLYRRDFRINAIALTLHEQPKLIDPTGGLKDLLGNTLVAINEKNLLLDPLRLIRGLRLMAEHNLTLDKQTKEWIHKNNKLLKQAAPERICAEIEKMVHGKYADKILPLIQELELLEHWQETTRNINKKDFYNERTKTFSEHERKIALPLARLTNILSDKGLQELRFSKRQQERCKKLRYWKQKNKGNAFKSLNEKERLKLHQELEKDLPALIIEFSLTEQTRWLERWRNQQDPLFHPSSPIDGNTLQDCIGVPQGPLLGELISRLNLENAFGRLENQEDAIRWARYWWEHKQTLL